MAKKCDECSGKCLATQPTKEGLWICKKCWAKSIKEEMNPELSTGEEKDNMVE